MSTTFPPQPSRHPAGLVTVAAMHLVLGWALLESLGHRLVDVVLPPLEVDIVEEQLDRPPPPPPPPLDVPPPVAPPPPSFVPPPEVTIRPPPKPPPITVQRVLPPPAPVVIAPPPVPTPVVPVPAPPPPPAPIARPAPPPAPPPAAPVNLARAPRMDAGQCARPEYPRTARRSEVTGTTRIRFEIDAIGRVVDARVLRSAGPSREHRLLDGAAVDALSRCGFSGGLDSSGRPKGGFSIVDFVWNLE